MKGVAEPERRDLAAYHTSAWFSWPGGGPSFLFRAPFIIGQISRKLIGQKNVQSTSVPPLALPPPSLSASAKKGGP